MHGFGKKIKDLYFKRFSHMAPEVMCCKIESRRAKLKFRGRYTIFRLLEYEMKDVYSVCMLFKQRLSSSRHR